MKRLQFGITVEIFANLVREVELHLTDGWNRDVPIIPGRPVVEDPQRVRREAKR